MSASIVASVRLQKGKEEALRTGQPWVYAGDLVESSEHLLIPGGSLVAIENMKGQKLAVGYFNIKSQIACRVLTRGSEMINVDFFTRRLQKAIALRDRLYDKPYYRMVHSEADDLPGLMIDRFDKALVVQVATAGMELMQPLWLEALEGLLKSDTIILRNDIAARKLEGLDQTVRVLKGQAQEWTQVHENGCIYLADLLRGQKTGWFYDQRDNRRLMAGYSKGKSVVDIYAHSGGFGLLAAKEGASSVTLVDSSELALSIAQKAAAQNQVQIAVRRGDAFEQMEQMAREGLTFDVVLADPPAFVKNKKDSGAGLKGYEKVAKLAAKLVAPDGVLFVASCSHHAQRAKFNQAVKDGVKKAGRSAEMLAQTGAAADHPKHPHLPQNEYLKGIVLKVS